jgi:hypothetical protein
VRWVPAALAEQMRANGQNALPAVKQLLGI